MTSNSCSSVVHQNCLSSASFTCVHTGVTLGRCDESR